MILVLNIGLKNARCIIFDLNGKPLADFSKPVKTYINNEIVEQSPIEWRDLSLHVMKKAISSLGKKKNNIDYITVTTSASCLVMLDKNKKTIGNSILVSDVRSLKESIELSKMKEFKRLKKEIGFKSSPDLMIPKIMWLKNNATSIYNKTAHYLNISDYLIFLLTGELITDPNNASKFYYSNDFNQYPEDLLNALSIDFNTLPNVINQGTAIGNINPKVSNKLGLTKSAKVVISTYDALAAVAGNGAFKNGDAVDVSGTVTSVRLVSDKKIIDPLERIYSMPHFNDNLWLHGGSNNLGGGIIEWTKQLFYDNSSMAYSEIQKNIEATSICPGGLLFLPYLLGDRTPFWNSECRGVFFGLNRSHRKKDLIKAISEGIGFSINMIFQVFNELNLEVNSLTVAGGLSRIDGINQIKSDMLNIEVCKYKNFETTAIGAALIALVGVGEFDNLEDAFNSFCSIEKIYYPNKNNNLIYKQFSELYIKVYNDLIESYAYRTKIMKKLHKQNINETVLIDNL